MGQVKRNRKQIASQWTQSCGRHFGSFQKRHVSRLPFAGRSHEDLLLKYKVITHKEKTP